MKYIPIPEQGTVSFTFDNMGWHDAEPWLHGELFVSVVHSAPYRLGMYDCVQNIYGGDLFCGMYATNPQPSLVMRISYEGAMI